MSLRMINNDSFMYAEAAKNSEILLRFASARTDYVHDDGVSVPHCFIRCPKQLISRHPEWSASYSDYEEAYIGHSKKIGNFAIKYRLNRYYLFLKVEDSPFQNTDAGDMWFAQKYNQKVNRAHILYIGPANGPVDMYGSSYTSDSLESILLQL